MNFKLFTQDNRLLYFICIILLIGLISLVATMVFGNTDSHQNEYQEDYSENYQDDNNVQIQREPFENKSVEVRNTPTIVLYYAMWCGYSKMFLPEWEKFEKYARDNLPNLTIKSVRCEGGDEATCTQKGVQGYPTVILYKDGLTESSGITFDADRTHDKLVEFVKNNM